MWGKQKKGSGHQHSGLQRPRKLCARQGGGSLDLARVQAIQSSVVAHSGTVIGGSRRLGQHILQRAATPAAPASILPTAGPRCWHWRKSIPFPACLVNHARTQTGRTPGPLPVAAQAPQAQSLLTLGLGHGAPAGHLGLLCPWQSQGSITASPAPPPGAGKCRLPPNQDNYSCVQLTYCHPAGTGSAAAS